MTRTPSRRKILQAVATSGIAGTVVSTTAGASPSETAHTVEAGLRYDFEIQDNFGRVTLNSRPKYTIDDQRKELIFSDKAATSKVSETIAAGALFAEQPVGAGDDVRVGAERYRSQTLPVKLSGRKRPMRGITTESSHEHPEFFVRRTGESARLVVPSEASVDIPSMSSREVRLEPRTVDVRTVEVTDELVPIEGRPKHRWGPKREYDSVSVEVTPVIEVLDHGELSVTTKELPQ